MWSETGQCVYKYGFSQGTWYNYVDNLEENVECLTALFIDIYTY